MSVVTLQKNYQIQIPYELIKKIDINKGDRLILDVNKKGKIIIDKFPRSAIDSSFGIWTGEKDGVKYVNEIRDDEEKRLEEIGIEKGGD